MNRTAHVKSIDAIDRFRAALALFGDDAAQALDAVRTELQRFSDWLERDQPAHWKQEIRRREERLAEAKADLHRCLAATIDANRTPSCYQERKLVEAAKRRLEEGEEKLAAVRRWIPIVREAAQDYQMRTSALAGALDTDVPKAVQHLAQLVARLEEYLRIEVPATAAAPESDASATTRDAGSRSTEANANHATAAAIKAATDADEDAERS